MKKWLVFLLGFIVGIVFTFVIALVISSHSNANNNGMTFFEQPGECLSRESFKVMQVIGNNHALAQGIMFDPFSVQWEITSLVVLITNDNGEYYYDDQIIHVPEGQCMRQIGIYKYPSKAGVEKTVPIVKLMNE